jgi:hypothetical protein
MPNALSKVFIKLGTLLRGLEFDSIHLVCSPLAVLLYQTQTTGEYAAIDGKEIGYIFMGFLIPSIQIPG